MGKLFLAEIEREHNLYRVLDSENKSHHKGTKEECEQYIRDNKTIPHDEPTGNMSMPSEYRYNPMYK